MSDATQNILTQAYELIENDKLDEAKIILEPLVTEDQDNPDVWWLYAHATDDVVAARKALLRVKKLDPNYPGVAELLEEAEEVEPVPAQPTSGLKDLRKLPSRPATTASASGLDDDDDDFDDDLDLDDDEEFFDELYDEDEEESSSKRNPLIRMLVVALVVVVVLIFGLIIITSGNQGGTGTQTPAAIAQTTGEPTDEPTDEPDATETSPATDVVMTETPEIVETAASPTEDAPLATDETDMTAIAAASMEPTPTAEDVTDEPTTEATEIDASAQSIPFADLYAALADFSVPDDGVSVEDTDLGMTTVVRVCTEANVDGTDVLSEVMGVLVDELATMDDATEAIAVHIGDCDQPEASRIVAVSIEDATAFTSGDIDENEFRRRWQPVG